MDVSGNCFIKLFVVEGTDDLVDHVNPLKLMEATLNGQCLQSVPSLVEQGLGSVHVHATTLSQDLVALAVMSLGKISRYLNVTPSLAQSMVAMVPGQSLALAQ